MVTSRALFQLGLPRPFTDFRKDDTASRPANPPRTAIVLPPGCTYSASRPNSMETVVRTLAGAMDQRDIRIFCSEGANDHSSAGIEVLPAGPSRRRVLIEKLKAFRPQVIEHHQQAKRATAIAAAMPGAAHLLYRHSPLKSPRSRLDAWRYNARYARMDGFVFVSSAERASFAATYPELAERAWAVPNPIEAEPWLASPHEREPVIAFAGRAMAEKGLDIICAALPVILEAHPRWRAVLMLNDWDKHGAWAAPHIATLDPYAARVTVLRSAPLSEVRHHMRSAAIALTPSVWAEPFGLTAIEAHAAGAALISSGRGGLREASGPHALYLDVLTPWALANAVDHLVFNPTLRERMAEAGQNFVLNAHNPEKRAAQLLHIRQTVVARRRRN